MRLRRISEHVRSENWFAVMLDLVVVVVGLFIGLQVDNWWEGEKDARLEGAYRLEIQEDFQLNKSHLESTVNRLEEIIRSMIVLQEQAALAAPSLPVAELNEKFSLLGSMPTFIPVNRAYTNLTGSGDLKLIRSRPLKNGLADYYAAAQITLQVQNTHESELVNIYEPYIIENLDYSAVKSNRVDDFPLPAPVEDTAILDVLGTRQFRNILTQKWVITTDLLDQHRGMLDRTNTVLELLQSTENQGD